MKQIRLRRSWETLLIEFQRCEVAQIHAAVGERVMKLHHQRFVLGANRADGHRRAVTQFQKRRVARRIRTNGESGKLGFARPRRMQNHPRIQGEEALGRNEQRIDVDLGNPRLRRHELTEANEQLLQRAEIHGLATTHALKGVEDFSALHQAPRECGVQGRQSKRAVLEHFDELSTGPEEQHGTELSVDAASEDQLVTLLRNHRLDRAAEEVFRARLLPA